MNIQDEEKLCPDNGLGYIAEAKHFEEVKEYKDAAAAYRKAGECFATDNTYLELQAKCFVAENINGLKNMLVGRDIETITHDMEIPLCTKPVENFIEESKLENAKKYQLLISFYREIQDIYSNKDEQKASKYYYKEKKLLAKYFWASMGGKGKKWHERIKDFCLSVFSRVFHLYCGYGEKTPRAFMVSMGTIFAFAVIYYSCNMLEFTSTMPSTSISFSHALYFSIITITTLGYGDIAPATDFGRMLASFEVLLGYIMLGALVAIIMRKIRR